MAYVSKRELLERLTRLEHSKVATLARLTATPASFETLGLVTDVVRDGFITSFVVGGDVMHVTVDALGDTVALQPIKRSGELRPVVINLANDTPEVDFTPETAKQAFDAFELFDKGPSRSGEELAAGLNSHVAR